MENKSTALFCSLVQLPALFWKNKTVLQVQCIFDEKLSRAQKIMCSRLQSAKKGRNFFQPNLTKLWYPLGTHLMINHAKKFWNRTRGSGDMGVQKLRNDFAAWDKKEEKIPLWGNRRTSVYFVFG